MTTTNGHNVPGAALWAGLGLADSQGAVGVQPTLALENVSVLSPPPGLQVAAVPFSGGAAAGSASGSSGLDPAVIGLLQQQQAMFNDTLAKLMASQADAMQRMVLQVSLQQQASPQAEPRGETGAGSKRPRADGALEATPVASTHNSEEYKLPQWIYDKIKKEHTSFKEQIKREIKSRKRLEN